MGSRDELESRGGHTFTYRMVILGNQDQKGTGFTITCTKRHPPLSPPHPLHGLFGLLLRAGSSLKASPLSTDSSILPAGVRWDAEF
eukprot:1527362-Rhodomonas_salina.4